MPVLQEQKPVGQALYNTLISTHSGLQVSRHITQQNLVDGDYRETHTTNHLEKQQNIQILYKMLNSAYGGLQVLTQITQQIFNRRDSFKRNKTDSQGRDHAKKWCLEEPHGSRYRYRAHRGQSSANFSAESNMFEPIMDFKPLMKVTHFLPIRTYIQLTGRIVFRRRSVK